MDKEIGVSKKNPKFNKLGTIFMEPPDPADALKNKKNGVVGGVGEEWWGWGWEDVVGRGEWLGGKVVGQLKCSPP